VSFNVQWSYTFAPEVPGSGGPEADVPVAISIAPTGAKVVSWERCTGCKLCTIACPYGTIFLDLDAHKAFKCNYCGGDPACARACPTAAIEWIEAETQDWQGPFAAERAQRDLLQAIGNGQQATGVAG
jgi:Fe-S-cluster-containing hydrogenase component 2